MKQKLIFISVIISLLPLVLFQIYFFYSSEKISIEREIENDFLEARYSLVNLSEKISSARSSISLIGKLTLLRVSLEFNRPESLNDFLASENSLKENFSKIFILDKNKNFFTSSEDDPDVFNLIKDNKLISSIAGGIDSQATDQIKESDGKIYILSKIAGENAETVGYLIAEVSEKLIANEFLRLRSRISDLENAFLSSNKTTEPNTYCQTLPKIPVKKYLCFIKRYKTTFIDTHFIIVLIGTSFCLAIIFGFIYKTLFNKILDPLNHFLENLQSVTTGKYHVLPEESNYPEIKELIKTSNQIINKLQLYQNEEIEKVKVLAVNKVAAQAAHDIRSPLEVFRSLEDDLRKLPDESRKRIKLGIVRIEEIAYKLLQTNKGKNYEKHNTTEDLLQIISSVAIEKRIEYRNKYNLDLDLDLTNGYGLFSIVNRASLKSIISNLVNNSIEAAHQSVQVKISLDSKGDKNLITVTDNGPGIPESILSKLLKETVTTKLQGNGLGLVNAYNDIKSWNGDLEIKSCSSGTTVEIILPKARPTSTFLEELNLARFSQIIVLDDDQEFLRSWKSKLAGFEGKLHLIDNCLKFTVEDNNNILLISDYDLNDDELNGITFLKTLPSNYTKYLTTALAEDETISEDCRNLGFKLIPKNTLHFLPVVYKDKEYILIDDDKLIQMNWRLFFEKKGISFHTYFSVDDFLSKANQHSPESYVYVDSDLKYGKKGEVESFAIYQKGFKNIFLATGYDDIDLKDFPWIKKIVGKAPPT